MKKLLLIFILVSTTSNNSFAENMFNVRMSGVALAAGIFAVEADVIVTDNISIGPMYIKYPSSNIGVSSHSLSAMGARANWYMNEIEEDGLLVGAFYRRWSSKADNSLASGEANANEVAVLVGYRWMWDNLNITAEGGIRNVSFAGAKAQSATEREVIPGGGDSYTGPSADISVGWFF